LIGRVQAEAMVGFFNAWQLSGNPAYRDDVLRIWEFIKHRIRDNIHGEWYWGIAPDGTVFEREKGGLWKTPYHNSRSCMELIQRLDTVIDFFEHGTNSGKVHGLRNMEEKSTCHIPRN